MSSNHLFTVFSRFPAYSAESKRETTADCSEITRIGGVRGGLDAEILST
jgi:hypothetical protein